MTRKGVMIIYRVQGHVGKDTFSKVESSHSVAESHTDRKSFKLAVHSSLKITQQSSETLEA